MNLKNSKIILRQLGGLDAEQSGFIDRIRLLGGEMEENDQAEYLPRLKEAEDAARQARDRLDELIERYKRICAAGTETQQVELPDEMD